MTPKPERLTDAVTLYEGEALAILASMEAGSVQAVVTDPPFGVRSEDWDDMGEQEFARFTMAWLAQARRLANELIVFGTGEKPLKTLCEMLWPRVRQMIWDKPIGSQYAGAAERGMWFAFEAIFHCHCGFDPLNGERIAEMIRSARESKGLSRSAIDMKSRGKKTGLCYRWEEASCVPTIEQAERLCSILDLNEEFLALVQKSSRPSQASGRDVFSHRTLTKTIHPCEKPVGLMVDLIRSTTQPGDIILDPFAGSGTTAIAAMMEGRSCILIERDPTYCDIIRRCVRQADGAAPGTLFREVARRESLFADEPEPEVAQ